ncbi:hypothetical protein [Alkaliphilus sp. B6464]|uniref:hypothetical protein n=1 Tax=Alkaliphilus sp. B6464 TaxID=2731219 RepID=UPI001BAC8139|nr:hypothetical protein [Alkaliphilus sp. B6464]QUH21067.1 hypothetical protein HYG84_15065 [Alkaliphilus sp. B6464]
MAYNTKPIITDKDGNPISQYYNPDADQYEAVEGIAGANKVVVFKSDGTENTGISLLPILDKLSQLTGTVIDEETRKSNELQRIALYEQIQQMLDDGELKGDTGETGKGLEYDWQGTQLGVRVEGDTEYIYVDLRGEKGDKGDKGDPGTIENLDRTHIVNALGYTPIKSVNDVLADESGNVTIETGSDIEIVNNLEEEVAGKALDATQGKILDNKINTKANIEDIPDISTKMDKTGGTFTGEVQHNRNLVIQPKLKDYTEHYESVLTPSNYTIDLSLGNIFYLGVIDDLVIDDIINYKVTNENCHSFTLMIQAVNSVSIIFPSIILWNNGEIPELTSANVVYLLTFIRTDDIPGKWFGMFGGEFNVS